MIALLVAQFARWGVAERLRKPLGYVVLAIVAVVLLWALHGILRTAWDRWLAGHDAKVIADDRRDSQLELGNRTIAADREAGAAKDARDREDAANMSQLREAANAQGADDNRTALDAVFNRLR